MTLYFSLQQIFLSILLCLLPNLLLSQITIQGIVTESGGQGLTGVSIYEIGNETAGTFSAADGQFEIQLSKATGDLVFSFTGMETQTIAVQGRTSLNIQMREDVKVLNEIFVTATSKPIRRIEATTAIESLSEKELERLTPTSLADLVQYQPGVYVEANAGRVRTKVYMRGFPDRSSSMLYTALMINGVRTFGSTGISADAAFRQDLNVGKVEIVRGSASTLYGRGAAAGVINVISRTGAAIHKGQVKATIGNNNWYQLDANVNGPLSKDKSWRYNAGGFLLTDGGYRNAAFGDEGGQFRFNIDKILARNKGNLRVYGGFINLNVNFNRDVPYDLRNLNKPAGNWTTRDVILKSGNAWEGQSFTVAYPDGEEVVNAYDEWFPKGSFSKGWNVGANLDLNLGEGWTLNYKTRYQQMIFGVGVDLSFNNAGGSGNNAVATFNDWETRILVMGGRTKGGYDSNDFINELRLTKNLQTGNWQHRLTAGGYLSLFFTERSTDLAFYLINTSDPATALETMNIGLAGGATLSRSSRNSSGHEDTYSLFWGDEIQINEKLRLNLGARYDFIDLNLAEHRGTSKELLNKVNHTGWNYSIGANYLLTPLMAIYGNVARSYRAPDFDSYTPVEEGPVAGTFNKPKITENEFTTSFEVGFRKTNENWSMDAVLFSTDITNRRIAFFIGGESAQVPVGDNHIRGTELSVIYTPQSVKGLYMRSTLTAQTRRISNLTETITYKDPANDTLTLTETIDFEGNKLIDIPAIVWNFSLGYTHNKFGINIHNNFVGKRWADPYNTLQYPSRLLVSANAYFNLTDKFRISVGSTNLLNTSKIAWGISLRSAGAPTAYVAQKHNYENEHRHINGSPLLPRRIFGSLLYRF